MPQKPAARAFCLLALFWVVAGLLVHPVGEFPLNDTWSFFKPIRTLHEENRLELSQWPAMTLIAHIVWGWLITLIFGFSFTILRISVAFLGFGGVVAAWQTLRLLTGNEQKALLGALAVGFNAIYFNLSYTFMTDVPFFCSIMWSVYFYLLHLRDRKLKWLACATLTASIAILIRQLGVFLPAAFLAAVVIQERGAWKAWIKGLGSLFFVYGVIHAYNLWTAVSGQSSNQFYESYVREVWQKILSGPIALLRETTDTMLVCMVMLGLFMFPLLVLTLAWRNRRDRLINGLLTAAGIAFGIWLFRQNRALPFLPQGIFVDFALGPPTLRDVFYLQRDNLYKAPEFLLWAITWLGCIGAAWLLRHIAAAFGNIWRGIFQKSDHDFRLYAQIFGTALAAIIFLPMAIKYPFDRYLLACLPGLLPCIAAGGKFNLPLRRWQKWTAIVFISGSSIFAVAGTHDYLAWNRARWQALDYLCAQEQIPPTRIDGGFEFNGWHLFDPQYRSRIPKSWWWVHEDDFIVTFGLIEHHAVFKTFPYIRWCPPRRDFIAIIKKHDPHSGKIQFAGTESFGGRNIKTADGRILRYWSGRWDTTGIACDEYVILPPGQYRARFTFAAGKTRNAKNPKTGMFRLLTYGTRNLLAETEITNHSGDRRQFTTQELSFSIQTNMRVNVHVLGENTPLWLDNVEFIAD